MIRRNVIRTASAILLLAATACDSDSSGTDEDADVVLEDGGSSDASNDTDAGPEDDGSVESDTGVGSDSGLDGGQPDADMDAAPLDADTMNDAQVSDAGMDAAMMDAAADAALTDSQVADGGTDAAQGDASPDASTPLNASYTFDENTGTSAADSTGGLAAATLVGGATWTTGKHGSALDLVGGPAGADGPHVTLPVDILEGCNEVTIAMWMKLGSNPLWARLLDIYANPNFFVFFTPAQWVDNDDPHLYFNIFHDDANPETVNDQGVSAAYPAGTTLVDVWHHVAFTLSGGTGRLYFDGVEIGSNPMLWTPATQTFASAEHAWLGRSTFPDAYLDASLDDLRIACTAYTAEEIAALAE